MLVEEIISEIRAEPYPYAVSSERLKHTTNITAEFETRDQSRIRVLIFVSDHGNIELSFTRDQHYDVTGTGDQFRILFTVLDFFKKHLKSVTDNENNELLSFSASTYEPSRVRLYSNRLVPEIERIIGPEWHRLPDSRDIMTHEFSWERIDSTENDRDN